MIVLAAAAIAAVSFSLGSYVFPHSKTPVLSDPAVTAGSSGAVTLDSFGIGLTEGAADRGDASAAASGTPAGTVLDAATLASLEAPVSGRLVGQYVGAGPAEDTIVVRVLDFSVTVTDDAGTPARKTLPRGVPVTLVVGQRSPGAPEFVPPERGGTVEADIRIEPARGDVPGRIVAVNLVAPGAKP